MKRARRKILMSMLANRTDGMVKTFAVLLGCASLLGAQSLSITSLTPEQFASGFSFDIQISYDGLSSLHSVEYLIDQRLLAVVRQPPYSYTWGTNEIWNGRHKIKAVARDIVENVLATSPETDFTLANGSDTVTVIPSASATSVWSGVVSLPVSIDRSDGVDSYCYLYVDGVYQSAASGSTTCTFSLDTTAFENGPHYIFVQASSVFTNVARGMWTHEVTINNAPNTQVDLRAGFRELFLTPGETAALTPTLVLADSRIVPATTSLPVSDNFNRANQTSLDGNWTPSGGSIKLVSNAITGNAAEASAGSFWNASTFPSNQYAAVTMTALGAGSFVGPTMRTRPGGTGYSCGWDGTTLYLTRGVNGVGQNLSSRD